MRRRDRADGGYWNPSGPPSGRNPAAYGSGSNSPSDPVDLPVVVVYDGAKDQDGDPSPKDIHEEIQPPVDDSDFYPALLVNTVSKVADLKRARERGAEASELAVLEEKARSAFLELESKHGIRVAEHAVFGSLYRQCNNYGSQVHDRLEGNPAKD